MDRQTVRTECSRRARQFSLRSRCFGGVGSRPTNAHAYELFFIRGESSFKKDRVT
jgi:hypothetical protein